MNADLYPSVQLDPSYSTQLKRTRDADSRRYLQKHLQDARWLIRSLDQRYQTILRIAAEIIRRQQRFMTHGELKPLTQRDITDSLELHPSTVFPAAAGKYMLTPNGTREFRSFFTRQIDVDSGPG